MPSAPRDFRWLWLFPSESLSRDPADGRLKRNHATTTTSAGYFETLSGDLESFVGLRHTIFGEPQQHIYVYQNAVKTLTGQLMA